MGRATVGRQRNIRTRAGDRSQCWAGLAWSWTDKWPAARLTRRLWELLRRQSAAKRPELAGDFETHHFRSMHGHCKQPKLSAKQEVHLVALHDAGEHTIGEVGGLFTLTRSTIYLAIGPQPRPRCPDRSIEAASTRWRPQARQPPTRRATGYAGGVRWRGFP
jgi:hypothetical protein